MFGMGMTEVVLILALALIVIGPKKLPEIAKALGRAMGEFKRATNDLKSTINIDDPIDISPTPVKNNHVQVDESSAAAGKAPEEKTGQDSGDKTETRKDTGDDV